MLKVNEKSEDRPQKQNKIFNHILITKVLNL
jgi:hypothetical protein